MTKRVWVVIGITLLLSACSNNPSTDFFHAQNDAKEIETLEKILEKEESTSESLSVFFDHQLVVAVQVQPLSKFQKSKIEKRLQKKVEKEFPNHEVLVSSDLKIMWELKDLVKKDPNDKALKKTLKDIQALAKEET